MSVAIKYIFAFGGAFLLSIIFTLAVKKIAVKFNITDKPGKERKIHQKPVPLLGGVAIFLSFFAVLGGYIFFAPDSVLDKNLAFKNLIGVFLAGGFLIIGGILDDKHDLPPHKQIIWPLLAVLTVIVSGVGVKYVTNPFGGVIDLEIKKFLVLNFRGIPYYFSFPADIFTLIWLLGMIYTTKFLDGLDGLVTGITAIGGAIIACLCLFTVFYQPGVAVLAVILAGSCLGFLIFNFHPAKIFLGEGGSTLCGFMLGVLAIISGGKFATALLVIGIAVLDAFWVISRRIFWERRNPLEGDGKHLHFRLLSAGFSHRQTVIFLYILSGGFGISSLFLQSRQKFIALAALGAVMAGLAIFLGFKSRKSRSA